jgi:hypothetical protein
MKDFTGTRANPKKVMTEEIQAYLENNHENKTLAEMGKHLNVSDHKVRCWLLEMGIEKNKRRIRHGRERELTWADKNGNFVWDKNCVTI